MFSNFLNLARMLETPDLRKHFGNVWVLELLKNMHHYLHHIFVINHFMKNSRERNVIILRHPTLKSLSFRISGKGNPC